MDDDVDLLVPPEPSRDETGARFVDWTRARVRRSRPARLVPLSAGDSESTDARQTVTRRWRLRLEPDEPITPACRVRWRGRTLEVVGKVDEYRNRGALHHLEATVEEVVDA